MLLGQICSTSMLFPVGNFSSFRAPSPGANNALSAYTHSKAGTRISHLLYDRCWGSEIR